MKDGVYQVIETGHVVELCTGLWTNKELKYDICRAYGEISNYSVAWDSLYLRILERQDLIDWCNFAKEPFRGVISIYAMQPRYIKNIVIRM